MPVHTAEILSVGTELLLGEIVDTNSAWLASRLAENGVDVVWSQRVGDHLERLVAGVRQALGRSDLLLLSGGLGPTDDDLTREALAAAVGERPEVDPELERQLRERFARFSRRMPEANLKQAWLIPSAEALPNPLGTAPGWLIRTRVDGRERVAVALPGPPRELKRMWHEEVLPRLELPGAGFHAVTFKTFGVGESALAERLGELTRHTNPSVATYAKRDGVHVRVSARAASPAEARAAADPVLGRVAALLGDDVWGRDSDELPRLLGAALTGAGLASAEQASGGLVAELLSGVPDGVRAYRGGVVAWSPEAMESLGLPPEAVGDGREEVALELAEAARARFGAAVAIGTSGAAVPPAEGDTVAVAVVGDGLRASRCLTLPPLGFAWRRERIAFTALALAWRELRDRLQGAVRRGTR